MAIATETIWIVAKIMQRDTSLGIILYAACVTLTLVGLAVSRGRSRWIAANREMTLGTPQDVTLQELRIETFFPADEKSEASWMCMTGPTSSGDIDEIVSPSGSHKRT